MLTAKLKNVFLFLQLAPTEQAAHVCPIFFFSPPPASSTSVLNAPAISSQREREGERRRRRRGEGGTRFISPGSKCNQLAFFPLPYFFLCCGGEGEEGKQNLFRDIWLSAAAARICSMKKIEFCPKRIPVYTVGDFITSFAGRFCALLITTDMRCE